ncbi:hypothetical protein XA68_11513 [Ophiocordyceps unilateralis]|uniref:Pentatricopeptide repeat domain-containing protein n=1 Tax=Ophiocordyceps unilateralis TaxID=268505 RepID=A0A2A9PFR9_OPHUN|nr:hypothetical protein XA68_11513 [Ophiocordyceps unilateralis]
MPCRPLLFERWAQSRTICQSCLYNLQRQAIHRQVAAYKTQTPKRPRRQSPLPSPVSRQPTAAELKRYQEGIKELQRASKPRSDDGNFSVRYFEEDEGQRYELDNEEAFNDSMGEFDGSELKNLLLNIKDALGTDEQRNCFRAVMREVCGESNNLSSVADVENLVARSEAYSKELDVKLEQHLAEHHTELSPDLLDMMRQEFASLDASEDDDDGLYTPPYQIPKRAWNGQHRDKVKRLNNVLASVSRDLRLGRELKKATVSLVYKAYFIARRSLSRAWDKVPNGAWDLLWKVLSADESIHPHRMSHISRLARDMIVANVPLSSPQQVLAMEAVFVDGEAPTAMKSWKKGMSSLGDDGSPWFKDFWELGVRMFCRLGELDEAQRAADKLLAKGLDARILMPIIRTLSEKETAESQRRAWEEYRRMRAFLGKDMQLADYDQVVSYFLTTHKTEHALYAFVDMMFDGAIDMKQQKEMPAVVANKYFLGKWLKRLIGAGDLAGAWKVVEFMQSKGVSAAPIQLNGLIGAWQRSGGAEDVENAERLGWEMIESRIRFVARRADKSGYKPETWPRATHETFALLAASYSVRSQREKMLMLWEAFGKAEMGADAFMMNQLLESHIQAGLPGEALEMYYSLVVEKKQAAPDPFTFSALWKTLAVSRLLSVPAGMVDEATRETRRLFEEAVRFRHVFPPDGMDGQLARKMLHSFRILGDYHGFLVALHTLSRIFNFVPTETLALELTIGTTKLQWDSPEKRRILLRAKHDMDTELMAPQAVDNAAEAADQLQGAARAEALLGHLRRKFRPPAASDEELMAEGAEAARQMGVFDLLEFQPRDPDGEEAKEGVVQP